MSLIEVWIWKEYGIVDVIVFSSTLIVLFLFCFYCLLCCLVGFWLDEAHLFFRCFIRVSFSFATKTVWAVFK